VQNILCENIFFIKSQQLHFLTSQKLYCAPEHIPVYFPVLNNVHSCRKEPFYSTYFLPCKATFTVAIVRTIRFARLYEAKDSQQEG
jgi:hypothetical protein